MALTKCKECGKDVSSTANRCPHCGTSAPGFSLLVMDKYLIVIGCLAVTIWLMWSFFGGESQKNQANSSPGNASNAAVHFKFDEHTRPDDRPMGEKAFKVLVANSGPLFKEYSGDIESIMINVETLDCKDWKEIGPGDFRCTEYGWVTKVIVKVRIKDRPQYIPIKYRAFGHTLTYEIGGGKRPGILTLKSQEQVVCGWPDGYGKIYIDVPEVNFIPGDTTNHNITFDHEKRLEYQKLAKSIGFDLDRTYSYSEYVDIKTKNKIGIGGAYEFLISGTTDDIGDYPKKKQRFDQRQLCWEAWYYSNKKLTIIFGHYTAPDGVNSWTKLLKIAKGRRPNLNSE